VSRVERRLAPEISKALFEGGVIPAHPLAVDSSRRLDLRRQAALTRYYIAAGAAGIAVGVHTTQFGIRDKGMLEPVLRLAAETVKGSRVHRPFIKVAGICGPTKQAVQECELAADLGYDLALLSPVGVETWPESKLLERARTLAQIMPIFGFYLQPAVGGRRLDYGFWKALAEIPGVMAIKVAPFSRYETSEVARAVANSNRGDRVALYTGNDDSIVADLLSEFSFRVRGRLVRRRFVGGLLGQFAIWTKFSVELLNNIKSFWKSTGGRRMAFDELLRVSTELTDANSAVFDARNGFKGSVVGIQEVLRRQGLVGNRLTINPKEELFTSQSNEIDRVLGEHPHLHSADDAFVKEHLASWLA
jgi:hypothetical protein